jgi:hypothetical protein
MAWMHPLAVEHRRKLYTRPDAWRLAPPGTPEAKMPGWLDPSMTRVRWKEAQEAEARAREAAAQEEFERKVLRLRWDFKKLKLEYELRRFQEKYSPSQPRVPAGSSQGGQWTSGAGGTAVAGGSDSGDAGVEDGDVGSDTGNAPPDVESLAQELRRFPASDQPPRSDRRELDAVANDPLIRAYMDEAWIASNPYGIYPKEHGFWISRDEISGQLFTRPFEGRGGLGIIVPGSPPPDAIASFHTHPYGGIQLGAAPPSLADEALAARMGLPGLIQSHVGVYYFGPPLRSAR